MSSEEGHPTLGDALFRGAKVPDGFLSADVVSALADLASSPEAPRPAGAVALDFTCDKHGGRLDRIWMESPDDVGLHFGREGRPGARDTTAAGRGGIVVKCTREGCRSSATLTSDWLLARLKQVRADFEAGTGPAIVKFPLSQVGVSRH